MDAATAPDYKLILFSRLLAGHLEPLGDPVISQREKMYRRLEIELQIETIAAMAGNASYYLAQSFESAFLLIEKFPGMLGAHEWYMDFLSGRSEIWLAEVGAERLGRIWRDIDNSPLRDKTLRILLIVELAQSARLGALSEIKQLFALVGIPDRDRINQELSTDQQAISQCLIQEALATSRGEGRKGRIVGQDLRNFSLDLLRECLKSHFGRRILVEDADRILKSVGDLGQPIRREFVDRLTV